VQNRVDFPLPSAEYRKRIWDGILLRAAPWKSDVDTEFLANGFELSGSAIKNIAVQAAFIAAGSGQEIGMKELISALVMEFDKTDRVISRQELGDYVLSL
jgi:ATP-dependent 26S proteasome regulatory subunit